MPTVALIAVLALAFPLGAQSLPAGAQSLKVVRPVVSRSDDGPPLENGAAFQPGDLAFFSFQVENYRMGLTGKVQLAGHIEVFDVNGTPILPRDEELIGTTLSQEDKNWKPKMRLEVQ